MRGKYSESSENTHSPPTCFNVHRQILGDEGDGDIGAVDEDSVTRFGVRNIIVHDYRGVAQH